MSFFYRYGWVCGFLEPDLKTPIGRGRIFGCPDKIRELITRTPTRMDSAASQALEHAIEMGRGGIFLEVTAEQYARLKD